MDLADTLAPGLVQAGAGVPVGQLIAAGKVEIGFQQLSELQDLAGITLLGGLPPRLEIITTFAGAPSAEAFPGGQIVSRVCWDWLHAQHVKRGEQQGEPSRIVANLFQQNHIHSSTFRFPPEDQCVASPAPRLPGDASAN